MMPWIGLHKLTDVISQIIQKPVILHPQTWSGQTSKIKEFFWTCFAA